MYEYWNKIESSPLDEAFILRLWFFIVTLKEQVEIDTHLSAIDRKEFEALEAEMRSRNILLDKH